MFCNKPKLPGRSFENIFLAWKTGWQCPGCDRFELKWKLKSVIVPARKTLENWRLLQWCSIWFRNLSKIPFEYEQKCRQARALDVRGQPKFCSKTKGCQDLQLRNWIYSQEHGTTCAWLWVMTPQESEKASFAELLIVSIVKLNRSHPADWSQNYYILHNTCGAFRSPWRVGGEPAQSSRGFPVRSLPQLQLCQPAEQNFRYVNHRRFSFNVLILKKNEFANKEWNAI